MRNTIQEPFTPLGIMFCTVIYFSQRKNYLIFLQLKEEKTFFFCVLRIRNKKKSNPSSIKTVMYTSLTSLTTKAFQHFFSSSKLQYKFFYFSGNHMKIFIFFFFRYTDEHLTGSISWVPFYRTNFIREARHYADCSSCWLVYV